MTTHLLPPVVTVLAERLLARAIATSAVVATAESCTGGLIAASLSEIPGSSAMLDRGFVTYSNEAKTALLGVPAALIAQHGAVSEDVARAMAEGALGASNATVAVSTTGVAGPGGGTEKKPVGMVCFGLAANGRPSRTETKHFPGDRAEVRLAATEHALRLLLEAIP